MAQVVLIVDDEAPIRRAVRRSLEAEGFKCVEAATGADALDAAAVARPALVILDLGLPDREGVDVCVELRGWLRAPILVLSARHDDTEKVALLDAGADDYLTKPFSPAELTARARALMRRGAATHDGALSVVHGDLEIDLVKRAVRRAGKSVHVTPIEWELLRALATNVGRVMTHQQLFKAAWHGREHGDAQQYLRVHVAHLRRKLEADPVRPVHIATVSGVGYRFGD